MKNILRALILFCTLWASTAEAANYAGTSVVWQVMPSSTAANVNGAGFNPANANFPTDGVVASGTGTASVVTPTSSYAFVSGDANHGWFFAPAQQAGIVPYPIWCPIASASGGAATLNTAIGACIQIINGQYVKNTVAGIATTATPTLTYGVDYSQQTAAQYHFTTGATTTTAFTDVTAGEIGTNFVGNFIHIINGGGTVGWYECQSETGGTCTLDRTAGTGTSISYYVGGAASLGSATANQTDLLFFEQGAASSSSAPIWWIQGGTGISYSIGQSITGLTAGNASWYNQINGFAVTRGDSPAGATRPTLAGSSSIEMLFTSYTMLQNLQFTGSAAYTLSVTTDDVVSSCYVLNTSTTASRSAINTTGNPTIINSELVSERGYALGQTTGLVYLYGNYIHDSVYGVNLTTGSVYAFNNVFSGNTTASIYFSSSATNAIILGNTFYGAATPLGVGINFASTTGGGSTAVISDNTFNGLTTATESAAAQLAIMNNYNNFYNNTTNYSNWNAGANDNTTNPSFTSVSAVTGTTATSATTVLTDSGKNFTSAGVVAGRDYVDVTSGTGQTNGIYGITAVGTTTLTLDNTIGTNNTGDLHYNITIGRNWNQTGLGQTTGFPATFPNSNQAALTKGNFAIGASQPLSSGGAAAYAWAR